MDRSFIAAPVHKSGDCIEPLRNSKDNIGMIELREIAIR